MILIILRLLIETIILVLWRLAVNHPLKKKLSENYAITKVERKVIKRFVNVKIVFTFLAVGMSICHFSYYFRNTFYK